MNKIRAEGAKAMGEVLKVNTTLTSLNLNSEEESQSKGIIRNEESDE